MDITAQFHEIRGLGEGPAAALSRIINRLANGERLLDAHDPDELAVLRELRQRGLMHSIMDPEARP